MAIPKCLAATRQNVKAWGIALVITPEIGVFEMDLRSDDVGNY